MFISRTPFRISFFGGGTDYPPWFRKHGGAVFGTTIDKFCYLSVRYLPPFFAHRSRIVWSKIELVNEIEEIEHPTVRAVLSEANLNRGLEVMHHADLPARSGLGSSSSFSVGLIHALRAMHRQEISKAELAQQSIHIEQNVMKEAVGSQDQVWAAHGGFNKIRFHPDGSFDVLPVALAPDRLDLLKRSLVLFFTGVSRSGTELAAKQINRLEKGEVDLHNVAALVDEAVNVLATAADPIQRFGELLHESWMMKRSFADGISPIFVDEAYEAGIKAGAYGGKLLGAGGGGFILFVVPPERKLAVIERLKALVHVNFNFEVEGSRVIVRGDTDTED